MWIPLGYNGYESEDSFFVIIHTMWPKKLQISHNTVHINSLHTLKVSHSGEGATYKKTRSQVSFGLEYLCLNETHLVSSLSEEFCFFTCITIGKLFNSLCPSFSVALFLNFLYRSYTFQCNRLSYY